MHAAAVCALGECGCQGSLPRARASSQVGVTGVAAGITDHDKFAGNLREAELTITCEHQSVAMQGPAGHRPQEYAFLQASPGETCNVSNAKAFQVMLQTAGAIQFQIWCLTLTVPSL